MISGFLRISEFAIRREVEIPGPDPHGAAGNGTEVCQHKLIPHIIGSGELAPVKDPLRPLSEYQGGVPQLQRTGATGIRSGCDRSSGTQGEGVGGRCRDLP